MLVPHCQPDLRCQILKLVFERARPELRRGFTTEAQRTQRSEWIRVWRGFDGGPLVANGKRQLVGSERGKPRMRARLSRRHAFGAKNGQTPAGVASNASPELARVPRTSR